MGQMWQKAKDMFSDENNYNENTVLQRYGAYRYIDTFENHEARVAGSMAEIFGQKISSLCSK